MTGRVRPLLLIVHSYYEEDPRVRRQAEALVAAGRPVLVVGLRQPDEPADGELNGVRIHRVDVQRHQGAGLGTYLREYLGFGFRAAWYAVRAHRRHRFGLVQVASLPDFLAFAALPLKLVGVPLILDLHEAMPVFFQTRFPTVKHPLAHRLLRWQERASIALSTATLNVNEAMRDRLVRLGEDPDKLHVVINSPAISRFDIDAHPRRAFMEDGVLRLVYTGALTPTYEVDVTFRALATVIERRPELGARIDLYGRGDSEDRLHELATDLGIGHHVAFHGRIPIDDVPTRVALADIGLAPTRHDPFTDLSLSTKVYEYAAMGKPVVASRLPLVERTFGPGTVFAYAPGDADAAAAAILAVVDDEAARTAAVAATLEVVRAAAWERESVGYVALIDRFATGGPRSPRNESARLSSS